MRILGERAELRELGDGRFLFPEEIEFTIDIEGMRKKHFKPKRSFHADTDRPTEIIALGKNKRKTRRTRVKKVKNMNI